jgi:flagellar protein FlgJ
MRTPTSSAAPPQQLAASGAALKDLKALSARDPGQAIKEVSKQFEALFMQELMKSMRATTLGDGMLENQASGMGREMLDQQYAMQLSGQPGGLAQAIARQLERQMGLPAATSAAAGGTRADGLPEGLSSLSAAMALSAARLQRREVTVPPALATEDVDALPPGSGASGFVQRHQNAAARVAASSGIPADFMLAQAAHETGWGRREIRGGDGTNSYNLFGIKAGAGWTGPTVTVTTTEVVDGRARKVQGRFRAYASYEESFRDYARLIGSSPRYAGVMRATDDAGAFAAGLQRAGYATDPEYANKLKRVIQTTQRLQRTMARADIET